MSAKPSGVVKVCPICNGKTKCIVFFDVQLWKRLPDKPVRKGERK